MKHNLLYNINIRNFLKLGIHLGTKKNSLNLKNGPYLCGFRHNVNIYSVEKIWKPSRFFFYALTEIFLRRNKFILVNPTKNYILSKFIKDNFNNYPFKINKHVYNFYLTGIVNKRWINGSLSNWRFISKLWKILKKKNETKKFWKYYESFYDLNNNRRKNVYPDFVVMLHNDFNVVNEVKNRNIPLMGFIDSDMNSENFLYKNFGNMKTIQSLNLFISLIKSSILKARLLEQKLLINLIVYYIKKNILLKHKK